MQIDDKTIIHFEIIKNGPIYVPKKIEDFNTKKSTYDFWESRLGLNTLDDDISDERSLDSEVSAFKISVILTGYVEFLDNFDCFKNLKPTIFDKILLED